MACACGSESVVVVDEDVVVGCDSSFVVGKVAMYSGKFVNMLQQRRNVREVESFDSENSGSGSEAGEVSDTSAGSPVRRLVDPAALPMENDDRQGAVGNTGFVPQASAGGDGLLQSPQPHHAPGTKLAATQEGVSAPEMWSVFVGLRLSDEEFPQRTRQACPWPVPFGPQWVLCTPGGVRGHTRRQRARVDQAARMPPATPASSGLGRSSQVFLLR